MAQMKEQIKTPRKELNKMEMSHWSDVRFKTLVIRMHKELSKCLNRIKKTQAETKDILMEIKNNLQGINGRMMKLWIKAMIWNTRKQKTSGQDRGVGRNPELPCTTKRRITTNPKSINNQKCQKIKLQGALTTKELKKKSNRTTRLVCQDKEICPKWKKRAKLQRERAKQWGDSQLTWWRI